MASLTKVLMDFGLSQVTDKRRIILYRTGSIRSYVMYELVLSNLIKNLTT